ncbi:MAG: mechanosensitive ion channel family protein [Candidatus Aenigmarchaeota archaeon]|nr:mechanosensitive ion channel family protein [Candidatus Aenigmarchaeota archaeon]
MVLEVFRDVTYGDVYWALAVVAATLIAARIIYPVFKRVVHHLTKKTETTLDDKIVAALEKPIYFAVIIAGSYFALIGIDFLAPYLDMIRNAYFLIGALFVAFTATKIISVMLRWYQEEIAHKTHAKIDDKLLPLLNKIIKVLVYAIVLILVLDHFGVEITPLVASLGIGGLAIALALQPTLSNFFAGTYIMSEGAIKVGDFIELENGAKGYVEEIGSRSTKIRTLPNNTLIIPNAKLADTMITNYYSPDQEMAVLVQVGVSYDSDLQKVEKVTIDVGRGVMKEIAGGVPEFEPFIRFNEFGSSNINFTVILRVKTFVDQYLIKHEFIKHLKERYDKEGIEISYPATNVHFRNELVEKKK